eukprot:1292143-Amphidinium_carterae.1
MLPPACGTCLNLIRLPYTVNPSQSLRYPSTHVARSHPWHLQQVSLPQVFSYIALAASLVNTTVIVEKDSLVSTSPFWGLYMNFVVTDCVCCLDEGRYTGIQSRAISDSFEYAFRCCSLGPPETPRKNEQPKK